MQQRPAPRESGLLDVGDGHRLHWEMHGPPDARPAVVLHGGPGSGASPLAPALFGRDHWRVTLFDQRGCGRSLPHAADTLDALRANTTAHLVADVERLRAHLGVPAWLVLGGSWGTTLGLAYAQAHRSRVTALVLSGVAMTRRWELEWLYGDVGALLPEAFAAFRAAGGGAPPGLPLVEAYARLLADAATAGPAAEAWCAWEAAVVGDDPAAPGSRWAEPRWRLGFARLVTHYFRHAAWLDEDALLRGAPALAGLPGAILHSRLDLSTPRRTAWELAQAWPEAEATWLEGATHSATAGDMAAAVSAALARLAQAT